MAHFVNLASLGELERIEDLRRRNEVRGADLVVLAKL
jgi:hypothetical protein